MNMNSLRSLDACDPIPTPGPALSKFACVADEIKSWPGMAEAIANSKRVIDFEYGDHTPMEARPTVPALPGLIPPSAFQRALEVKADWNKIPTEAWIGGAWAAGRFEGRELTAADGATHNMRGEPVGSQKGRSAPEPAQK